MIFKAKPKQTDLVSVFYVSDEALTPIGELGELQIFLMGKFVVMDADSPNYKYAIVLGGRGPRRAIKGGSFLWFEKDQLRVADRETVHNFLEIDSPLASLRG